MTSLTSASSESLNMLSYVRRAFCSAARFSVRSVIGSPVDWIEAAVHGEPDAEVGYTAVL